MARFYSFSTNWYFFGLYWCDIQIFNQKANIWTLVVHNIGCFCKKLKLLDWQRSNFSHRSQSNHDCILAASQSCIISLFGKGANSPLSTNLRKIVRGKRRATARMTRREETSRPSSPLSLNCLIFFTTFSDHNYVFSRISS